jgi:acyl-coenzyme A synthetase/AMP-(fatty) acid ligase
MLLAHRDVQQAAVMAVQDDMREEEVLACVVLTRDLRAADAGSALFERCFERLAYYKAPGWIHVLATLPTTGTQKIQKHDIYRDGTDPQTAPGIIDLRARKRRDRGTTVSTRTSRLA